MTTVGPTVPQNHPLLSPSRPTNLLAQLTSGQTVYASVERLLPGGEAELRIGTSLIRVNTPVNLAPGQPLTLKVELSSQGPLLRANQEAQQLETIASAWRSAIPKQKPLAEVFSQLQQLLKQPAAEQLPKPVRSALDTLVQQAADVRSLSRADSLRQALQQSGPQLEAHLLRASLRQQVPATGHDLKAGLLRAAQQVLHWQTLQPGKSTNTAPSHLPANTPGRAGGVGLYHALLNTAAGKTPSQGEALPLSSRPLLPPILPLPPTTGATTDNRLLSSLQPLLERLLPASLSGQTPSPLPSPATGVNLANIVNVTVGQALQRIAADILNQLEAGLARIQHHQLTAMPNDEPVRTVLNTELPLFNNQQFSNIGIRIEQEELQQQQHKSKHIWRAVVNFDLPGLGKVQAVINIQQHQVNTEFRSENEAASEMFRQHINLLQTRLQAHGLKTGNFHFTTGINMPDTNNTLSGGLLHTEA